jgi:sarcosine oxidase
VTTWDVGIVGLGAMGSMTALALSRRGCSVVGFDRFRPPHALGSSHGKSRIIREAYFEHPQYVPIVRHARKLWNDLERESGQRLLVETGGLMVGTPAGTLVAGARRSAELHALPFEELSALEVRRRFPVFLPRHHEVGLFEPRAGVLFPEVAVDTALDLSMRAGADLHFDEPVLSWQAGSVITITAAGGSYSCNRLVLAAGAWMAGTLPGTPLPLRVARQPLLWFAAEGDPALVAPGQMPIFIWEWAPDEMFYGFPDFGDGVKIAIHHQGASLDPDGPRPAVTPAEVERLRGVMAGRTPALNGVLRDSAVCLYTNTPNEDFLIDRSALDPRVILASPCSGHGFKFSPAIGEILADLALDREPQFDLSPFRL